MGNSNFIKKRLNEYFKLNESLNEISGNVEANIILFHGSNNRKIYDKFYNNQFYTVNDYIASNYAYNFGGLMYEVKVRDLKPFVLEDYDIDRDNEKYNQMVNLLTTLYGKDVSNNYEKRYFSPSPSSTFGEKGWKPLINWCLENGYDSIKFHDESFDTFVNDISYLIFDGSKPEILNIYEVEEAVESNFTQNFKKINESNAIDTILDKINNNGIQSLTDFEKSVLAKSNVNSTIDDETIEWLDSNYLNLTVVDEERKSFGRIKKYLVFLNDDMDMELEYDISDKKLYISYDDIRKNLGEYFNEANFKKWFKKNYNIDVLKIGDYFKNV